MLIFDLDDTLIDTSGSIAPPLLKKALLAMINAGLEVPNPDGAFAMLHRLYSGAPSGKSGMREFVELMEGEPEIAEVGIAIMYNPKYWDEPVRFTDGAHEMLRALRSDHHLALVTMGDEAVQKKKLSDIGVAPDLFSMVCVTPSKNKGSVYRHVIDSLGFSAVHTLVCGDRISLDLTPAKQLGATTVHMRQGRGLGNTGLKRDVDYTILNIGELPLIVEKLTFSNSR